MGMIRDYTIRRNGALDYDFKACDWAVARCDNIFLIDAFNETPELGPNILPGDYYSTILDRFVGVVMEKFQSNELNKWPFEYSP
jgi:hypothetical protein